MKQALNTSQNTGMNRLCYWAVSLTLVVPLAAGATDSRTGSSSVSDDQDRARHVEELVRQLGDKTFSVRQRAQRELIEVGLPAKSSLEIASTSNDAELRRRAKQALAEILDADFWLRLEAFLADDASDDGHGLPGWLRYRDLAGGGPQARRLFGDMQRAEGELLQAADENPKRAGDLLEARCTHISQSLEPDSQLHRAPLVPPATLAALLLVAADPDVPISTETGRCLYQFCRERALEQAVLARDAGDILRRLLVNWIERPLAADSSVAYWNMVLGMENEIKESLSPAITLLAAGAVPAHLMQYAILAVGKFGGVEQLPLLEPLLDDTRSIAFPNRGRQELDAQVRDVALAALVHLSGQKLVDYGFSHVRTHPSYLFIADSLGFSDPAQRDRALQIWREHRGQGTGDRE